MILRAGRSISTANGGRFTLGQQIGAGGEGAVYEIVERRDLVAKVYHEPIDARKAAKLQLMTRTATPALLDIAAWPIDVLIESGSARGLVMPRVERAREAHCVYSPKQRQQGFPNANWEFLVWAARNVAAAVDTVHAAGHVIGDLNQKGVLIADDARVRLIDCDSFQIVIGSERHLCLVGVPEFTAPELTGQSFDRTVRSPNHDAFSVAVLIFHMLFMGRHPFAGRYAGADDMPVERAVREFRFAYSRHAASMRMAPPPHSLPLHAASFRIAGFFEKAFGRNGVHGDRPTPREWVSGLEVLRKELKICANDRAHAYHESLQHCPWCQIERAGGPSFFIARIVGDLLGSLDAGKLRSLLDRLRLPRIAPSLPVGVPPAPAAAPLAVGLVRRRLFSRVLTGLAAMLLFAACAGGVSNVTATSGIIVGCLALAVRPTAAIQRERGLRREAIAQADRAWRQLTEAWERDCTMALAKFHECRDSVERQLMEFERLPAVRQARLQALHSEREKYQRQAYLDRFDVETAPISGIGAGLKAMLTAYGFETANDITMGVERVKGIGPVKRNALMAWRRDIEAGFRFDPRVGVSPAQIAAVEREMIQQRRDLERSVAARAEQMPNLHRRAAALLAPDRRLFERAAAQLAQARADAEVV